MNKGKSPCVVCQKYVTSKNMSNHMNTKKCRNANLEFLENKYTRSKQIVRCLDCNYLMEFRKYRSHKRKDLCHSVEQRYDCDNCLKTFFDKSEYEKHIENNTSKNGMTCGSWSVNIYI